MSDNIFVELTGTVKSYNKSTLIASLVSDNTGKTFNCKLLNNLPLWQNDKLYCLGELNPKNNLITFTRDPLVNIDLSNETVIKKLTIHFREKDAFKRASTFVSKLKKYIGQDEVSNFLAILAQSMIIEYSLEYKKLSHMLDMDRVEDLNAKMKYLLKFYMEEFVLRRLILLGLTKDEIYNCNVSPWYMFEIIIDNPYKLYGYSLEKAQQIIKLTNNNDNIDHQYMGKINRFVYSQSLKGNICVNKSLVEYIFKDYNVYRSVLESDYNIKSQIINNQEFIYLNYNLKVEKFVAEQIKKRLDNLELNNQVDQNFTNDSLSEEQVEAIKMGLTNNISIITGGAGTGKTTIIKEIISQLSSLKKKVLLLSYTGKAVSRIKEVIDEELFVPTMTIDLFNNSHNRVKFDHIIIDEVSMVTTVLMYKFLSINKDKEYAITFIGDINQLPPISCGNLFQELLKIKEIPIVRLTHNFRLKLSNQTDNNILINSNNLINQPDFKLITGNNCFYKSGGIETVVDIFNKLLKKGYSDKEITIISPYSKADNIVNILNQSCITTIANKSDSYKDCFGKIWKEKDRVMMNNNNYDINVMNGEEGEITQISSKDMKVNFSGKTYRFKTNKLDDNVVDKEDEKNGYKVYSDNLVHSYAISIHRCVSGDSLIYTSNGLVRIDKFHDSKAFSLISRSEKVYDKYGSQLCIQSYNSLERKQSLILELDMGYRLEIGLNHPIMTQNGWKIGSELRLEDQIEITCGTKCYGHLKDQTTIDDIISIFVKEQYGNKLKLIEEQNCEFQLEYLENFLFKSDKQIQQYFIKSLFKEKTLYFMNYQVLIYLQQLLLNNGYLSTISKSKKTITIGHYFDQPRQFYLRIKNITRSNSVMYDLSINSETHEYLTNGITSHNSQGSEWKCVIIYTPNKSTNSSFLNKNMLYTGMTRSKEYLFLVGDLDIYQNLYTKECEVKLNNLSGLVNLPDTE